MLGQLAGRVQFSMPGAASNQFWVRLPGVAWCPRLVSRYPAVQVQWAPWPGGRHRRGGGAVRRWGRGCARERARPSHRSRAGRRRRRYLGSDKSAPCSSISQEDSGYNSSRLGVGRTMPFYSRQRTLSSSHDTDDDADDDITEVLRQPLKDDDNRTLETFHEKRRRMNQKKRVVLKGGKFFCK